MSGPMCPDCGGALAPGRRVHCSGGYHIGVVTPVLICWACGYEDVPLYPRSRIERNDVGYDHAQGRCAWCDRLIVARRPSLLNLHCSTACSNTHNAQQRTAERRAEMTRSAFLRRVS